MIIITTDASHCPETHAAAYAGAVENIPNLGTVFVHNTFKDLTTGPSIAEVNAMAACLRVALKERWVRYGDSVSLETDCQEAISAVAYMMPRAPIVVRGLGAPFNRAKRLSRSIRHARGLEEIRQLSQIHDLDLSLAFVTSRNNARSEISGRIDQLAKQAMREERNRRLMAKSGTAA